MNGQSAQVIVAQRFVNISGQSGMNLSDAIMREVINTQKGIEKAGMKEAAVIVRQVIVTGMLEIKATIIMDIMQVITMVTPEERRQATCNIELLKNNNPI